MDLTSYLMGKQAGGGGGITPTGTINITENGTVDVTNYASANVNVSGSQEYTIKAGSSNNSGFGYVLDQLPSITIDDTSCAYMFQDFFAKKIPVLKGTANVTNMNYMFRRCGLYADNIDTTALSNFNTSNVTSMSNMFDSFKGKHLDLSSFNTSKVTTMASMFQDTSYLATLDISSFDLSSLTSFSNMFLRCGAYCKQADGAYAEKIPYVYVKDATMQNWVLTASNGHPNTWTTDNVVIKS